MELRAATNQTRASAKKLKAEVEDVSKELQQTTETLDSYRTQAEQDRQMATEVSTHGTQNKYEI